MQNSCQQNGARYTAERHFGFKPRVGRRRSIHGQQQTKRTLQSAPNTRIFNSKTRKNSSFERNLITALIIQKALLPSTVKKGAVKLKLNFTKIKAQQNNGQKKDSSTRDKKTVRRTVFRGGGGGFFISARTSR